mmetsp:Transcript_33449/g.31919  ORF Transcript_33449/g.31919 Transcript_33449/m.31919 type:complete len:162 (-) Transcript_33449:131-616(-)
MLSAILSCCPCFNHLSNRFLEPEVQEEKQYTALRRKSIDKREDISDFLNVNENIDDDESPLLEQRIEERLISQKSDDDNCPSSSDYVYKGYGNSERSCGKECVICLVEFSQDNPRMPTLCACGENRAAFHYPCLLLYLENTRACPVCSQDLYYQDLPPPDD